MGQVALWFSMSLDGFVAGSDVSDELPMGRNGEALHDWMFDPAMTTDVDREVEKEWKASVGAVVVGRRTFDVGLKPWGDTPYPAPCFVLTHEKREPLPMRSASFTFVNDGIESIVRQAREAAEDKDVVVMGGDTARQVIAAGLADALHLQIVPMLLGSGTRIFDDLAQPKLRQVRVRPSTSVIHASYEVVS